MSRRCRGTVDGQRRARVTWVGVPVRSDRVRDRWAGSGSRECFWAGAKMVMKRWERRG